MKIREAISQFKALAGIMHGSRAFGGPYQVNLSMTRRSNIRCVHCFFHSPLLKTENMFQTRNAKTPKEELSDEKLMERARMLDADGPRTRELIQELAAMGTRQLTFTGDGEPFLIWYPNAWPGQNRTGLFSYARYIGVHNGNGDSVHP